MDKKRAFLNILSKGPRIEFIPHFDERHAMRTNISEKLVEDLLLNHEKDLLFAGDKKGKGGLPRYELYYETSRKKLMVVIVDVDGDCLKVVTAIPQFKKNWAEAIRDAAGD